MACINRYAKQEHHQGGGGGGNDGGVGIPMSPRISFSNDFVVESASGGGAAASGARIPKQLPDPNFEFSVGSRPMMAADELFFKGRLLPLHESGHQRRRDGDMSPATATTLRDELLSGDADESPARSNHKAPLRWKELLGLKKPLPSPNSSPSSLMSRSNYNINKKHYEKAGEGSSSSSHNELAIKELRSGGEMGFEF